MNGPSKDTLWVFSYLKDRVQGELHGLGNTFGFPKSRPGMALLTNGCSFLGLNKSVLSENSTEGFLCDG